MIPRFLKITRPTTLNIKTTKQSSADKVPFLKKIFDYFTKLLSSQINHFNFRFIMINNVIQFFLSSVRYSSNLSTSHPFIFYLIKCNSTTSFLILGVTYSYKWVKVFKNGPSKICGWQPLKNLKWYTSNILKAVFHKFYLVHSWIRWPK